MDRRVIKLELSVRHDDQVVANKTLEWQGLLLEVPHYLSPFHQTISTKAMEERPLGVERHFERLFPLVKQGRKSFLIYGPRRFGKTTLLRALGDTLQRSDRVAVTDRVVASEKDSLAAIWKEVGSGLEQRFDRPVQMRLTDLEVPAAGVFDKVRVRAREAGYDTIYLLIDEAQALFALHPEPQRYGTAIKRVLEEDWGRTSPDKATLLLGLVGQSPCAAVRSPVAPGLVAFSRAHPRGPS